MNSNTYATQPKDNSRRSWIILKLQRDWPAIRLGLKNGRKLNRLSTKQLEAKVRQSRRIISAATNNYVNWLDSLQVA